VPFCHGDGVPRRLAEESYFSLCYHRPAISDRWRHFPARGSAHYGRQHAMGVAVRSHRRRHRVSTGMALCAAFYVLTDFIKIAIALFDPEKGKEKAHARDVPCLQQLAGRK